MFHFISLTNYKGGFGWLSNELWLGNENTFILTSQGLYPRGNELRVELVNSKKIPKYAKFKYFYVNNESLVTRCVSMDFQEWLPIILQETADTNLQLLTSIMT